MAVTRSTAADRQRHAPVFAGRPAGLRTRELFALIGAAMLVAAALLLAYSGRMARLETSTPTPINLSQLDRAEQLYPYLTSIPAPAERQYIARKIFEHVRDMSGNVPNVGAIGRIRVPIREITSTRGLPGLQTRAREHLSSDPNAETLALLTSAELSRLKPSFVVRNLGQFRNRLWLWGFVFFAVFFGVHVFWTYRAYRGASLVLPALELLSGIGLVLMITLRDPLRDTMMFVEFVQGVGLGCIVLAIASTLDYQRLTGRLSYIPLLAGFLLSAALIVLGTGPGGSDAKVNLLGFQPAELIRILDCFLPGRLFG